MMYILEQRLKAQTIPDGKSATGNLLSPEMSSLLSVLHDVVKTMCNAKFLDEVFRPQDPFTPTSMRGVFSRLAHSSIMRLSDASMDKVLFFS